MDWNQLKEKAKEMGYNLDIVPNALSNTDYLDVVFYKDGRVMVMDEYIIARDISYDKMLMIMRGLE